MLEMIYQKIKKIEDEVFWVLRFFWNSLFGHPRLTQLDFDKFKIFFLKPLILCDISVKFQVNRTKNKSLAAIWILSSKWLQNDKIFYSAVFGGLKV